jgi:fluoroquinolone resistance protein
VETCQSGHPIAGKYYNAFMTFPVASYYREQFSRLASSDETITSREFEECEFTGCSFIGGKFEKCRFVNCKFDDCVLSAVVPMDCRFTDVEFRKCKVIGIDWTKTGKVRGLDFEKCQVNYSNFRFLKIPRTRIVNCEAREADFTEAGLRNGDFRNTDFEKSRFFKTDLSGANFRGATNYSIDVTNNVLKKACFSLPEAMSLLKGLDITVD